MKQSNWKPISLHPDNPHYFLFRGKPTILFTSGEHYSLVMNRNFDYVKYLDTIQKAGFNHTRVYTGIKRERVGEHSIDGNSLAVLAEDFIGPWVRTDVPGALDGGNKYDLNQFNEEYFENFKKILKAAGERGIELEIILFGPLHMGGDGVGPWGICPLNFVNNINGVGNVHYNEVLSLKHKDLVQYMDAYVRKIVTELNEFDNLHYEIANEPYAYPTTRDILNPEDIYKDEAMRLEWQQHVADLIYETEKALPEQHLISCNYLAGFCEITRVLKHVDLYCMHYVNPSMPIRNYSLNKAIGMNETGILTSGQYVRQCWKVILGGLSLYNMLDYTFNMGHEDGTYEVLPSSPAYTGKSGTDLRAGLKVVNDFINSFDFVRMRPAMDLLTYDLGLNVDVSILAEKNKQYAVYRVDNQHSHYPYGMAMGLKAEDGMYCVEIINPADGIVLDSYRTEASDGIVSVHYNSSKCYEANHEVELAIRIKRADYYAEG